MANKPVLLINGEKLCTKCNTVKPVGEFHKAPSKSGCTSHCKECRLKAYKRYCERNPDLRRQQYERWVADNPRTRKNSLLKHHYGITIEDYDAAFLAQGGACAICKQPKKLHVDHCHSSRKFRGLLCNFCNTMLGKANEDITVFESAIAYLRKYKGE